MFDSKEVGKVGRVSERSRFRRAFSHNARESALTSAGFVKDEVTGDWIVGGLDNPDYLEAAGWELDKSFPEVPASMLRKNH